MTRDIIYLDNAATTWPKPKCVAEAMARFVEQEGGSPNRAGHRMSVTAGRIMEEVRIRLARLINADDPSRIIHAFSCTDALNIALKGAIRAADHVICTVLDHNSISRPLQAMANAGFITLTRLPMSGSGCVDPDAVRAAITPATRLVATVQASNVTGVIQPAKVLGGIAREHDVLFLLDAAQTVGVFPIDVKAMNIDLLAFPGHKSLHGPTGTGGLYVGERAELRPFREGGTGLDSITPTQPEEFPTWLEAGTPNSVGLAGLDAALDELDPPATLAHERAMLGHLAAAVADDRTIRVVGDWSPVRCVGVMSLTVDGMSSADVATALDESYGIAVRPGLHCAPYIHQALGTSPEGTIRVSPGWSTVPVEIERFASALRTIADG